MAVDVIRYSGDLKIATAVGGTMTFDTGVNTGTVVVTGNLIVRGTQTAISSTNTNVRDNILVLNAGETNGFVSLGQAGVAIDRGNNASSTSSATLIYDDTRYWAGYRSTATTGTSYRGVWSLKSANKLGALEIASLRFDGLGPEGDGRFNLLGNGVTGMLSVAGQSNYASRVTHDDDIPNKKYVDDRPFNGTATSALTALELRQGNTYVEVSDDSVTGQPSRITAYIDGASSLIVRNNNIIMAGLNYVGNTIRPSTNGTNLTLQTQGTGTVVVNNGLSIGYSSTAPQMDVGVTKLYTTSTLGAGSTGIMFVTRDISATPSPATVRGELISARKALVLSIIF